MELDSKIDPTFASKVTYASQLIFNGVGKPSGDLEVWFFEKIFVISTITKEITYAELHQAYHTKFMGLSPRDLLLDGEWYESIQDMLSQLEDNGLIEKVVLDDTWRVRYDEWGCHIS